MKAQRLPQDDERRRRLALQTLANEDNPPVERPLVDRETLLRRADHERRVSRTDGAAAPALEQAEFVPAAEMPKRFIVGDKYAGLRDMLLGMTAGQVVIWTKAPQGRQSSGNPKASQIVYRLAKRIEIRCEAYWASGKFYIKRSL